MINLRTEHFLFKAYLFSNPQNRGMEIFKINKEYVHQNPIHSIHFEIFSQNCRKISIYEIKRRGKSLTFFGFIVLIFQMLIKLILINRAIEQ
jgi:hypothetical protein